MTNKKQEDAKLERLDVLLADPDKAFDSYIREYTTVLRNLRREENAYQRAVQKKREGVVHFLKEFENKTAKQIRRVLEISGEKFCKIYSLGSNCCYLLSDGHIYAAASFDVSYACKLGDGILKIPNHGLVDLGKSHDVSDDLSDDLSQFKRRVIECTTKCLDNLLSETALKKVNNKG